MPSCYFCFCCLQDKPWIKMPKWTIFEISFLWKHQCLCCHYWDYLTKFWLDNLRSIGDVVKRLCYVLDKSSRFLVMILIPQGLWSLDCLFIFLFSFPNPQVPSAPPRAKKLYRSWSVSTLNNGNDHLNFEKIRTSPSISQETVNSIISV